MIHITQGYSLADAHAAVMFAARKQVFVDLLGWDVPVVAGRYEIDQFDGDDAIYLIAAEGGEHLGSLRLLPTNAPHILGDLFPQLCDGGVPRGAAVYEITRLCLPPRLGAAGRLRIRNRLISAMVDHALPSGIATLTGVVASDFRNQVMAMGWACAPLGRARRVDGAWLGAFRIDLDPGTPERLAATGIYLAGTIAAPLARQAA
jgi:acyl homoserine lactone synthase